MTTEANACRYEIGIDANEPSEILITDHVEHIVVARSSKMALRFVEELVQLANQAARLRADTHAMVEQNMIELRGDGGA